MGLEFFGSILGIFYGIKGIVDNHSTYNWEDWLVNLTSTVTAAGWGAQKVGTIINAVGVATTETNEAVGVLAGTTYLSGLFAAGTAVSLYQGYRYNKRRGARNKSTEILRRRRDNFKKAGDEEEIKAHEKYEKGLRELNSIMAKKEGVSTGTSVAGSTALLLTSIFALPVLGLVGAAAFVTGVGVAIWGTKKKEREKRLALFDSYFKVDDIYAEEKKKIIERRCRERNVTKEELEERDPVKLARVELTPVEEERLRGNIRSKMATSLGFSSVKDASGFVAMRYGEYVESLMFSESPQEQDLAKEIIKGLGLTYEYVADPKVDPVEAKKNKPKAADIAAKLG